MREKRVSFFERVKIREIRPPYNSSDEFSLRSDDELDYSELEYHMALEKGCGDGGDIDSNEIMLSASFQPSNSLGTRYSTFSNKHIVDFSGKVYTSASSTSSRRFQRRQTIPSKLLLLPKMDRWQSQSQSQSPSMHRRSSSIDDTKGPEDDARTDATVSSTSLTSEENDDTEVSILGLSTSNSPLPPPPLPEESPSMAPFRKANRKRLGRIKEDHSVNHYFRPHSSAILMSPPRRASSTESLTSRALYLHSNRHPDPSLTVEPSRRTGSSSGKHKEGYNNSSNNNNSFYKSRRKTTSAPSLTWFKSRSRKPNHPSLAESQNATFHLKCYNHRHDLPPLPSRSMTLLETINSDSTKSLGNSTSSRDTATTACSEDGDHPVACCTNDIESLDDEEESLRCDDEDDPSSSESTPEKPSSLSSLLSSESSSSRRSLLQRSIGSLRNLASKSPRSKKKGKKGGTLPALHPSDVLVQAPMKVRSLQTGTYRGNNDLPPVRPIRTASVQRLQIDDS